METLDRPPRRPKGVARERALLEALRELLADRPLGETDVTSITSRAGVGRSAFYAYFPTKQAAVAALLTAVGEELVGAGSAWYEDDDAPPDARVARGMRSTVAAWRKHARLIVAAADASASDPIAATSWSGWQERFVDRATERIASDPAISRMPAGTDPRAVAHALVDLTVASMLRDLRHLITTGHPLPDIEQAIVHIWSHALYH